MNKQELKKILDSHAKWLRSEKGGMRANLSGANLERANLQGANLSRANLQGADLCGANLERANLSGANLCGANLWGADLRRANLQAADLWCTDLWCADLRYAYLKGANLKGAYLKGANYILQWQSPQGFQRTCYSVKHDDCVMHKLGCFWGNTEQAIEAIREKYGNDSMYENLLVLNAQALEVE